jgi:malate dehydrogenase (oxaloacetate-decarboxylating)(NADP+)
VGAGARPRPWARSLVGMKMPVHVLQRGIDVADIVNMAAIAVVDAQEKAAAK